LEVLAEIVVGVVMVVLVLVAAAATPPRPWRQRLHQRQQQ
jgi:hypothetical protein